MVITSFERFNNFVSGQNRPTQRAAEWIEQTTRQVNQNTVLSSAGTPEGSVTASPYRMCVDTTNDDLYYKKTGAGNTGWVLLT